MASQEPDDLVRDFPVGASDARPLPGFVGTSERERHVRLHRLRDLNEFLDIPEEDVVHRSRVSGSTRAAADAHSILWVKRTASMAHTVPASFERDDRAALLLGSIVNANLGGASTSGIPGGGPAMNLAAAGSSGTQSMTTLDCWHCCSVGISGC